MPPTAKISPKDAANAAVKYLSGLLQLKERPTVEEVEYKEDTKEWHITLGYVSADSNPFGYAMGQRDKEYKIFRIDAENGEILSMKIRKIS